MRDNMNIATIYERFPTNDDCITYLEHVRWDNKPQCPYCKSLKVKHLPQTRRYHCNTCRTSFSVTVGTIFHRTHLPLQKWFLAISIFLNEKKGLSARQLSRDLKINKDTAWRMTKKIREAMKDSLQRDLLRGIVGADELFTGGKLGYTT